jgi:hypothetical protein
MNPRSLDPKESATLYALQKRYEDAYYRLVPELPKDDLADFVRKVEQLEQHYHRKGERRALSAPEPSRNGTGTGGAQA